MPDKKITIFTPTFNRAYIIHKLYNSLKNQTSKDFIWLIVDDGSSDNTSTLVEHWIKENAIRIEYFKQNNQGKSIAHNKGICLTNTELFTCVDSDDYLDNCAVEDILKKWSERSDNRLIGILAYKGLSKTHSLTKINNRRIESTTLKYGYSKHGLRGDTMLIFKTDVAKKYNFPKFTGEKFVPEAYLYDLIDQDGELLILRKILYYCEYLEDGYTKNMTKLLLNNPNGYLAFINQRLRLDRSYKEKTLDTVRYTAMSIASEKPNIILSSEYPILTILTYPISHMFYVKRYKGVKNK